MSECTRSVRKELFFAVLVITTVLLVIGLVMELTLRLLGYGGAPESIIANTRLVDDPILDWRYKPNTESQWGKVVYRYNDMGFRGENHAFEKPEGAIRIVVIGDSVTEGYGVEWPDVFTSTLQKILGSGYEVVNLGMGGLNTPQEVHILQEVGVHYQPDYVVVNFVLNDCDFFSSAKEGAKHAEDNQSKIVLLGLKTHPSVKRALKSSALIYLVNERVADLVGRLKGEPRHDYYSELWADQTNRAKVTTAFEKLQMLSRNHRFKVVVLVWPFMVDYSDYKFSAIHKWIIEQSVVNGFIGIDLLPVFAPESFRSLQVTSEDYVHPNSKGHKMAAAEFAKWMTNKQLVPIPVANQQ
jgi:lysophospholipase L1-like esterase